MDKDKRENLVNDIENRLDDFFNGDDTQPMAPQEAASMEKLKSVILSIDWEITESCLTDLIDETDILLPQYEDNRYAHTLLRMLRAVGGYIRKRKAQAHPDAIKRIMSVFKSLEKLTGSQQLDAEISKRIVGKEIAAFKTLKDQVDIQRGAAVETQPAESETAPADAGSFVDSHQFEQAIHEVEARLDSQVSDLKAQLAVLQKELDALRNS